MNNIVEITEFKGLIRLNGVENKSSIYPSGNKYFLKGEIFISFSIASTQHDSISSSIPPGKIEVKKQSDSFILESSADLLSFDFKSVVAISSNDYSPILYFKNIKVSKSPNLDVSFEQIGLSLIGEKDKDQTNNLFFYSTTNGQGRLNPLPSQGSGRLGFYLRKIANEPCLIMGAPSNEISFNNFGSISLTLSNEGQFIFNFANLKLNFSSTKNKHAVTLLTESGWEMDIAIPGFPFSSLEIENLICSDGWIESNFAVPSEPATISKIHDNIPHQGKRTKLFASKDHFSVNMPLELRTPEPKSIDYGGKIYKDVPQIVYKSNLDEPLGLLDQHYGIRICGLENEKGASVKLDADVAVLRFNPENREMMLNAGNKIKVKGNDETNSVVLPKQNPQETNKRIVRIPCLPSTLVIQGNKSQTSVTIDTAINNLTLKNIELETSPFSPANLVSQTGNSFDKMLWSNNGAQVDFLISNEGIHPIDKQWTEKFQLNQTTSSFQLLNSQNSEIFFDSKTNNIKFGPEITTTVISTKKVDENEKEKLIYLAYAGTLGFGAAYLAGGLICETASAKEIYTCLQKEAKERINIKFDIRGSDPNEVKKWLINNNVNELAIAFYDNNTLLQKFIDDNIKITEPTSDQRTSIAFWPVTSMIGIPLIKKVLGKKSEYCFDIIEQNFPGHNIKIGLGIDQNKNGSIDLPNKFGFTPERFKDLATARKFKSLFPTFNKEGTNGRVDPTSNEFVGVIFKNMPLMVKVPSDKIPDILGKILDRINENLFLELGWRDDRGFNWIARIPEAVTNDPNFGIEIVNTSIVNFTISRIESTGVESKLLNFTFDVFVGLFQKADGQYKIPVQATASITFNEKGVDNFTLIPNSASRIPIDISDVIPGFDFIRVDRFETNFKQLFATVELFPNEKLANALPIFDEYKSQTNDPPGFKPPFVLKTVAAFDWETGSAVISIVLDSSRNTKLFSKWPLSIKAINIYVRSSNGSRVEVAGEFNLGMNSFIKIGGRVVIAHKKDGGWDFDIQLDRFGGSLALSDELKIEGELAWGSAFPKDDYDPTQPAPKLALDSDKLITEGKNRDFYGVLFLKAPGIFGGSNEIFVKIASRNGIPYWVCGLRIGAKINLGFGTLLDPELIISKNSDFDSQIDNIVTNVDTGIKSLRKPDDQNRAEWLQKWQFSDKTGFTIISSGFLVYDLLSGVVTAEPDPKDKKFTGLLYSSAGIIRIEGYIKMFEGIDYVQVLFTIDLRKKRILVGFQLPTFYFPDKLAPTKFVFQPGQILLGSSFGGPLYLLASFGYPPQIGDSYDRDWSKANQVVYEPPTFPIPNMFGGGFKFEFDEAERYVLYAVALKTGWKYDINFAIGKAGFEVSIGGVLMLKYVWGSSKPESFKIRPQAIRLGNTFVNSFDKSFSNVNDLSLDAFNVIQANYLSISKDLKLASESKLIILGEVFADIKGYAAVEIFGITLLGVYLHAYARLRICGDTDRGITHIGGSFGAEFCVKIGCVTYCKSAEIIITIVSGDCEQASPNYQYLIQS